MASKTSQKAAELAKLFLETSLADGSASASLISQMEHRLMLASHWNIAPGSRVLEIGCGQGDCTIVLADAVGEEGHVDALDPGSPDYGSPFTLSQAQSFISGGAFGSRITFHNTNVGSYLSAYTGPPYDYAVMCHCLWYFETPKILSSVISSLAGKVKNLAIAEWSLRASKQAAQPHVLASLVLCAVEARRRVPGGGNIRTVLSAEQIIAAVNNNGSFVLDQQTLTSTNEGLRDAYWEVEDTLRTREDILKTMNDDGVDAKGVAAIVAMLDALKASVDYLPNGLKDVKTMDVLVATFKSV